MERSTTLDKIQGGTLLLLILSSFVGVSDEMLFHANIELFDIAMYGSFGVMMVSTILIALSAKK